MKNRNTAIINTDLKGLMKYWLQFTQPFHNLTNQQQDVLSLLLYHYFKLKKDVKNDKLLWKMVFDYDTKSKIKKELNDLPDYTLQNILSTLRKKNVIKNNKIINTYIPKIESLKENKYALIYVFNIKDEQEAES